GNSRGPSGGVGGRRIPDGVDQPAAVAVSAPSRSTSRRHCWNVARCPAAAAVRRARRNLPFPAAWSAPPAASVAEVLPVWVAAPPWWLRSLAVEQQRRPAPAAR